MLFIPFFTQPSAACEPRRHHVISTEANIPVSGIDITKSFIDGSKSAISKNINHKSKIIDIEYEAENQGYAKPSKESISAFVNALQIVSECKLGIKSYTPIYEGGVAFDIQYNGKYIHVQFDNEECGAIYLENSNQVSEGWDLPYNETLTKLRSLLS